jgi:hypothetical protein
MEKLTNQQIFDKVATHLLNQGKRAMFHNPVTGKDSCAYRGQDRTKCAAGCLIPDDRYDRKMEGFPVSAIRLFREISNDENSVLLLADLQRCHDVLFPDRWKQELMSIAEVYGLDASILATLPTEKPTTNS